MSRTLQQVLEQDWFGAEKTASAKPADDMDKIAMELGLFGDMSKVAEDEGEEAQEEKEEEKEDEGEEEKTAGFTPSFYESLFPEDSFLNGTQKTAAQVKQAQEEKIGARAFDHFSARFGRRIEKLAADIASGDATISAPLAGMESGEAADDSRPAQAQPGNRPDDANQAIDTDPEYTDEVSVSNDERTVGQYEAANDDDAKLASLAFQKHLLLAQLRG